MKVSPSLLLLLVAMLCLGCDDDNGISIPTDFCSEAPSDENCLSLITTDWESEEAFRNAIIGDWEVVAFEGPWVSVPCSNLEPEDRIRFTFSADGVYTYTLPDGQTETTSFQVGQLCGFAPPCEYIIEYEDESIGYRPFFQNTCFGFSFVDDRPLDGGLEVYVRNP
ncbi:MAG: hypothetical protein AAFO91_18790 [Bacteroidota bacterium]